MRRITPKPVYGGAPCSVVAVGCAMGQRAVPFASDELHLDGYLSLDGMNRYVRKYLPVKKRMNFKRGHRPILIDFVGSLEGQAAVICVKGHYIYFNGKDYYSFFGNDYDEVICAWVLRRKMEK